MQCTYTFVCTTYTFVYTAYTTCTSSALSCIYKHIICCAGKECGYREGVKYVGVTENLLSLCPANAPPTLLGFVATCAGSVGSVDKSVGSVDKSVGISPLHTLRNALKIN